MNKQSFLSVEPSCRNHARSALCVSMLLVGACSASKGSGASAAGGGAGMPSGGSDGAGLGTGGASGGGGSTTPGIGGMGVGGNLGIGGHLGVGGASVTCMQPIPITSGTTATVTADFGALGETVSPRPARRSHLGLRLEHATAEHYFATAGRGRQIAALPRWLVRRRLPLGDQYRYG